jgi:ATP/ADP translocase
VIFASTSVSVFGVAAFFWVAVPLERLFDAFQPMIVALSVIIAAIFVRLNRGMPTLEWKSLEREKRTELTSRIVELSREYVAIVAINVFALIVLVTLLVIGKEAAIGQFSGQWQRFLSSLVGALFSLCLARMAYVVWRDCDIMELQKYLIDNAAERESSELETKSAESKLSDMKSASLRKQPPSSVSEL